MFESEENITSSLWYGASLNTRNGANVLSDVRCFLIHQLEFGFFSFKLQLWLYFSNTVVLSVIWQLKKFQSVFIAGHITRTSRKRLQWFTYSCKLHRFMESWYCLICQQNLILLIMEHYLTAWSTLSVSKALLMEFTSDIFLLPHFAAVNSSISDPFAIQDDMLGLRGGRAGEITWSPRGNIQTTIWGLWQTPYVSRPTQL